ncbi:hypothetical protein THASP1DRAFT_33681 [Thamnocephalis sphaerospora]|uniref:SPX domain-containing protein n=1 Tax=Thamnocephalis sphaerospora TaxID=78915 RepID=A0A4P9XH82_9FUNG|nr:hypothetical protein THASP1DRAFT_33681 [Thamnocephalis sphaerospora]|eukprot:RKP04540.1 hypothetical protein THASP1DRAFT_33681 [Thamnocephalis sphaerospora]
MKYAKQLALRTIPAWCLDYIDYKALKKYIREHHEEYIDKDNDPDVLDTTTERFETMITNEIEKVNQRYERQEKESTLTLDRLDSEWRVDMAPEDQEKWRQEFSKLLQSLEYLAEFVHANVTGFQKILKKFDKQFPGARVTASMWPRVVATTFARSEKDENLLIRARQVWRRRVPLTPSTHETSRPVSETALTTASELNLEVFPPGQISRLWVALAQDGLGEPIKVPVIVAKASARIAHSAQMEYQLTHTRKCRLGRTAWPNTRHYGGASRQRAERHSIDSSSVS